MDTVDLSLPRYSYESQVLLGSVLTIFYFNLIFDNLLVTSVPYLYQFTCLQAVWISVPQSLKIVVEKNYSFRAGLHAACHAVLHVVPL